MLAPEGTKGPNEWLIREDIQDERLGKKRRSMAVMVIAHRERNDCVVGAKTKIDRRMRGWPPQDMVE